MKSVRIRSFSGLFFPASLRTQSKCGKIQTRKTPHTDTFQAVLKVLLNCSKFLTSEIKSLQKLQHLSQINTRLVPQH